MFSVIIEVAGLGLAWHISGGLDGALVYVALRLLCWLDWRV